MAPTTRSQSSLSLSSASIPSIDNVARSTNSKKRIRIRANSEAPPLYTVDLSKPPNQRFNEICNDFKHEMSELAGLYDDILSITPFPRALGALSKVLLRGVHSKEETEEIRGIAKATGIPHHLVVAYNTFLDLFSGCISGGVKANDATGIIHFRGLDWDMDPLRDMIIRVQYMRNGEIVARTVTYAGYVGILTGVREGLSISLNYRARLNSKTSVLSHRLHQLRLLLGWRPSISSQLRQILLAPGEAPTLEELIDHFSTSIASPCYLTFCSPSSILIIEKDLKHADVQTSDEFLAVTNHDRGMESWSPNHWQEVMQKEALPDIGGVRAIVNDSIERKECVCELWRARGSDKVTVNDIKMWLRRYPLRNECTHFSCIMDPSSEGGGLVWVETCEAR